MLVVTNCNGASYDKQTK